MRDMSKENISRCRYGKVRLDVFIPLFFCYSYEAVIINNTVENYKNGFTKFSWWNVTNRLSLK